MLIMISLKHVVLEPIASRYHLILKPGCDEKRYLKINIGRSEGEAVECWLKSIIPPRPMTYDMLSAIFSISDKVSLKKIIIDNCEEGVYYAKMIIEINDEEASIDCRPSDAIAVGIRLQVPIFVDTDVLEKYGFIED